MQRLEDFIYSLENENKGPRRSALIDNMYYHIFSNGLVGYIGQQNIAKQLQSFHEQGEDVFFWKSVLVNSLLITPKITKAKNIIDELDRDIINDNNDIQKYKKMWTKFCLVTSCPQLFLCFPSWSTKEHFLYEMYHNAENIYRFADENVKELLKIATGTVHNRSIPTVVKDSVKEEKHCNICEIEHSGKTHCTGCLAPIRYSTSTLRSVTPPLIESEETVDVDEYHIINNDSEESYDQKAQDKLFNEICDTHLELKIDGNLFDNCLDSEESEAEESEEEESDIETCWKNYIFYSRKPESLIARFSDYDFKNKDQLFINLIKTEIERYLICARSFHDPSKFYDIVGWRRTFNQYGPKLIDIHKKICKDTFFEKKCIFTKWNVYLQTNEGCFLTLFNEFFSNLDNMYCMYIHSDHEQVESLLDRIERFNFNSPIIDVFYEYVCSPVNSSESEELNTTIIHDSLDSECSISYLDSSSYETDSSSDSSSSSSSDSYEYEYETDSSSDSNSSSSDSSSSSSSYEYDEYTYETDSYDSGYDEYTYESDSYYSDCEYEEMSYKEIVQHFDLLEFVTSENINDLDENGETLIMNAVRWRCDEAVVFLCNKGADLNIQNPAGKTVLHMTSGKLHKDKWSYVPILLQGGADPFIRCNTGKDAMIYAIYNHAYSTIRSLKQECGFSWFQYRNLIARLPYGMQQLLISN